MNLKFNLKKAALTCDRGGIISYPTESVYGLGCNPDNFLAVKKILQIKQRPVEKGLILIASDIEQLKPYISGSLSDFTKIACKQASPTTWLVKASRHTPDWIKGNHSKVAVRITEHITARQLCEQLDYPLVSTSANPAGKNPARSSLKSRIYFSDSVDFYLSGDTGDLKMPSKIIDLETNKVIRNN